VVLLVLELVTLPPLKEHRYPHADRSITGGEYSVCTTQAVECADSTDALRKRRGLLVAVSTNVAIISGFVGSSIVSLIVIAAYGGKASDGIWRICFGIGIFVSSPH
jgi:MFS family permease